MPVKTSVFSHKTLSIRKQSLEQKTDRIKAGKWASSNLGSFSDGLFWSFIGINSMVTSVRDVRILRIRHLRQGVLEAGVVNRYESKYIIG